MDILDRTANFAKCTVSTGYDASATSISLSSGEGSKLPTFPGNPYNMVWWNSSDYADPCDDPNREIVRVTARTGDALTLTRAQESTSAATHNASGKVYKMSISVTNKLITDINAKLIVASAFRARKSGDQTLQNTTWTKCLFATQEVDIGGMYDEANSRFAPPTGAGGMCLLTWGLYVSTPVSGQRLYMAIYKNGSIIDQQYVYASGTDPVVHRMTAIVYNTGGDYFEAWAYQAGGSSITMNASSDAANFAGFVIGPGV